MNLEEIDKILKSNNFIRYYGYIDYDDYKFSRTLSFKIRDNKYKIIYFCNYSTLKINDEIEVLFDYLSISTTWPNHFMKNLELKYKNNISCIIPIEE